MHALYGREAGSILRRMPETLTRPRTAGPDSGTGGSWGVIVRHDDHNTLEHVARPPGRVIPGISHDRGLQIADQIHNSGQAIVYSGQQEPAEHYWEQLKSAGLT